MRRRTILAAAALAPAASLTDTTSRPALAARRQSTGIGDGRLVYGIAEQAGLLPRYIARIRPAVESGLQPSPERPLYPGAVVLAARDGVIAEHAAVGDALRYASSAGEELPPEQRILMRPDTIFDVASLSKLFTAVVAMQQVELGRLDLDAPVAHYIPDFAAGGKQDVTVRQLMTHTAGLPAGLGLDPYPTIEERLAAVFAVGLRYEPGTQYLYSDLSFIVVGAIVERLTGQRLDEVVRAGVIEPLGLRDTMYNPPAELRPRIAPTEWQEGGRGLIWGEVHDRTSWLLGGTAGHAGVFSTAADLAVFVQTMLNGGRYGSARILRPQTVAEMLTNGNVHLGRGAERGLGFQLAQYSYMGAMRTPDTYGHTGFTGTSLVADPATRSFVILLSNRVHPTRAWSELGGIRRTVANEVARAVAVRPMDGREAWFSGMEDDSEARLTLPVPPAATPRRLSFAYWWDTEADYDVAHVETSTDGVTWTPLPLRLHGPGGRWDSDGTVSGYQGRRWYVARAVLPADARWLRWRYSTDAAYVGRGVYVDRVRITTAEGVLFDERRPADDARWLPDGFTKSAD
jgi:CubicO group peptidase (beta-lactamase class C family)